jgi:hypothetical protein
MRPPRPNQQQVLVVGSGRGGTTAVQEAVTRGLSAASIWEPLRPESSASARRVVPPHGYPLLRAGHAEPALRQYLEEVLSGRRLSRWSTSRSSVREIRSAPALVTKEVRANRILGWFLHEFPDVPVIAVVRHPLAVVQSMMRAPRGWSEMPWEWLVPPAAAALRVEPRDLATPDESPALWLFAVWLADTIGLAEAIGHPNLTVIMLEDLYVNAVSALAALRSLPGFDESKAAAGTSAPSSTASETFVAHKTLRKPGPELSDSVRVRVGDLLAEFGLRLYSVDSAMPRSQAWPLRGG